MALCRDTQGESGCRHTSVFIRYYKNPYECLERRIYALGGPMSTRKHLFGRMLTLLYALGALSLFLYSYTQVDLGLTLSRATLWPTVQKWFQSIGYFNRPLSTVIYIFILAVFFVLFGVALHRI